MKHNLLELKLLLSNQFTVRWALFENLLLVGHFIAEQKNKQLLGSKFSAPIEARKE